MGKLKRIIDYSVGVQQGDNMAPLLFLLLIQAFNQSYAKKYPSNPDTGIEFRTHRVTASTRGCLVQQPNPAQTKGTAFEFDKSLFVDDTAYLCGSRDRIEAHADRLLTHFRLFGLLMHVGECDEHGKHLTKSNTEAMYFPASPKTPSEMTSIEVVANGECHYSDFTHLDKDTKGVNMVDVGGKQVTARRAKARTTVVFPPEVMAAFEITGGELVGPKGPIFATAKIAGIMAAR